MIVGEVNQPDNTDGGVFIDHYLGTGGVREGFEVFNMVDLGELLILAPDGVLGFKWEELQDDVRENQLRKFLKS
jgi:hypothetical protein